MEGRPNMRKSLTSGETQSKGNNTPVLTPALMGENVTKVSLFSSSSSFRRIGVQMNIVLQINMKLPFMF